jgi:ABC-type polysaccharide/polyol phosphate export permease
MWTGDYPFLLSNLIQKDFKIRYRNMSLGVFWSLLNPLVMMGVLTFVFTRLFPNPNIKHYAAFVMCGLVPYNFFAMAWICGTTSLVDNAGLIKRVLVPREMITIASVLSNVLHFIIQIGLLLAITLFSSVLPNRHWVWLPYMWGLEVMFLCGLSLITSALNIFIRDMRYVVESSNTVLFWLVPIFYSFSLVRPEYRDIYLYNPLAAIVMISRTILLDGMPPERSTLIKLTFSSVFMMVAGLAFFRLKKQRFYDYL